MVKSRRKSLGYPGSRTPERGGRDVGPRPGQRGCRDTKQRSRVSNSLPERGSAPVSSSQFSIVWPVRASSRSSHSAATLAEIPTRIIPGTRAVEVMVMMKGAINPIDERFERSLRCCARESRYSTRRPEAPYPRGSQAFYPDRGQLGVSAQTPGWRI